MRQPAAEYVNPATLTPWARNPRKNDPAVGAAADSITRFGWGAPILARHLPDGSTEIIAGHTRIKAAIRLNLAEVPVRWMDHLNDDEAHALALADNKIGELAEWDVPELTAILRDLEAEGEPLDGLGWDKAELDALLGTGESVPGVPPDDFKEFDEEIATDFCCPKCGYAWSGKPS